MTTTLAASATSVTTPTRHVDVAGDFRLRMPSLADAAASGEQAAQRVLASLDA